MPEPAPILIAGGGIGGLALALALAKTGRRSTVLEQRTSFGAEGAGIQIGPNGVRVLQGLGLAEALRPMVGVPDALEVHRGHTGKTLAVLPLGRWIAERHGAPYWVVHRGDLHAVLVAATLAEPRITLRPGFELATVAQRAEVEAGSADGEIAAGAALIGADGLWSSVRRAIHPDRLPLSVGATASRTVIPAAQAGLLASPVVGLWLRPGVNVAHYPVRGGSEIAVVVIAREAWTGKEWDAEADKAALAKVLAGFHASLAEPLSAAATWRKWGLHRLAPLPSWSAGRVALIGDAAHPMLPHLAQGGVLALEDAIVLADCLAARPGDEAQAFTEFEAKRRRRTARVQAMSRLNGRIYHLPPPMSWARDAVLRLLPGEWLMSRYDWLYGWRADTPAGN
jgi:2-polyprenyl-6-methoxyphenol hydroxylase-like FAD-dependent oxidoreductase